mgnify:FL=1
MKELSSIVGMIATLVEKSGKFKGEFKKLKQEDGLQPPKRVAELENECYQLLDSNARIALLVQQLGMDLRRVYKRFKNLEGGSRTTGIVGAGTGSGTQQSLVGSDDEGNGEMEHMYGDIRAGAEFLQGEEKERAYRLLKSMEKRRERRGEVKRIGGQLDNIARRIDKI